METFSICAFNILLTAMETSVIEFKISYHYSYAYPRRVPCSRGKAWSAMFAHLSGSADIKQNHNSESEIQDADNLFVKVTFI